MATLPLDLHNSLLIHDCFDRIIVVNPSMTSEIWALPFYMNKRKQANLWMALSDRIYKLFFDYTDVLMLGGQL